MYRIIHRFRYILSLLLHRLLPGRRGAVPTHVRPLPVAEDPEQVDWSVRDAMLGTVRNREQLHYNLSHNCYYVPARFMRSDQPPVEYIALHERDEAEIPCIVRIGRIKAMERVERRTIPVTMRKETDPKELYCYYTVEEWLSLPHRLLIRDTAKGRPLFTSRFLLEHCRISYELFVISSREDYKLLEGIYVLLGPHKSALSACRIAEDRTLTLQKGCLVITTQKGGILGKVPVKTYTASPRSSFLYLKKFLT